MYPHLPGLSAPPEAPNSALPPPQSWDDLPDDCWALIIARLDPRRHHRSLSQVCSRFLAFTNRINTALFITNPPPLQLRRLHARFPNLQSLHLSYRHPALARFLRPLADSGIPLRSLHLLNQTLFPRAAMRDLGRSGIGRTLKTLSWCFDCLGDGDLVAIAKGFSYLHSLQMDCSLILRDRDRVTDEGIRAIAMALTSLVSFGINCSNSLLSHRSFECLSTNCPLLRDLKVASFDTRCSLNLLCFISFTSLTSLELVGVKISDSDVESLSRANFRLSKLLLMAHRIGLHCHVNSVAVRTFLKSCQFLDYLNLTNLVFIPGMEELDFAPCMPNVRVIHLCFCSYLPQRLLLELLDNCPYLEEIHADRVFLGDFDDTISDLCVATSLRKVNLSNCFHFYDEILAFIGSACPNLEAFSITDCSGFTERGVGAIIANCRKIKLFTVTNCVGISDFSLDKEILS